MKSFAAFTILNLLAYSYSYPTLYSNSWKSSSFSSNFDANVNHCQLIDIRKCLTRPNEIYISDSQLSSQTDINFTFKPLYKISCTLHDFNSDEVRINLHKSTVKIIARSRISFDPLSPGGVQKLFKAEYKFSIDEDSVDISDEITGLESTEKPLRFSFEVLASVDDDFDEVQSAGHAYIVDDCGEGDGSVTIKQQRAFSKSAQDFSSPPVEGLLMHPSKSDMFSDGRNSRNSSPDSEMFSFS